MDPAIFILLLVHEGNFLNESPRRKRIGYSKVHNKICVFFGSSSFIELTLGIQFFIVFDQWF
ncbi:hypothetical protein D1BOALGB6SA_7865 [Olavius sp. associated proteobacterium Delta 1]|nr:hypothetical protein D1BOALGB6SA_7865 [Olavius sp. associated proteobacterium Delta 1]